MTPDPSTPQATLVDSGLITQRLFFAAVLQSLPDLSPTHMDLLATNPGLLRGLLRSLEEVPTPSGLYDLPSTLYPEMQECRFATNQLFSLLSDMCENGRFFQSIVNFPCAIPSPAEPSTSHIGFNGEILFTRFIVIENIDLETVANAGYPKLCLDQILLYLTAAPIDSDYWFLLEGGNWLRVYRVGAGSNPAKWALEGVKPDGRMNRGDRFVTLSR